MDQENEQNPPGEPTLASEQPAAPPKVVSARELFGDAREVRIDFHGEQYRLRITRRNKLILQK